jgi:hypothetical protein
MTVKVMRHDCHARAIFLSRTFVHKTYQKIDSKMMNFKVIKKQHNKLTTTPTMRSASEAVKTKFGSNSEFFFHKKIVFAQKND